MVKYSILVPVYNAEKYLRQCLNSIEKQQFKGFEVIVINDGSTDGSSAICEEYALKDPRIQYFSQSSKGCFGTRMELFKRASGEYIVSLDADDYLEPDALSSMDEALSKTSADVLVFGFHRIKENGQYDYTQGIDSAWLNGSPEDWAMDCKGFILQQLLTVGEMGYLWRKCFRRKLYAVSEDYYDLARAIMEDELLSFDILLRARSVVYLDRALYNYRYNPASISAKLRPGILLDIVHVGQYIEKRIIAANLGNDLLQGFYQYYANHYRVLSRAIVEQQTSLQEWVKAAHEMKKFSFFHALFPNIRYSFLQHFPVKLQTPIKQVLILTHPEAFYFLIKIKQKIGWVRSKFEHLLKRIA